MHNIKILGTGCPKCNQLAERARAAVTESGVECVIEKVTDINEITRLGVMVTPALVLDGEVMSSGTLLTVDQIRDLISNG